MEKQTVYVTDAQDYSEIELRLRKMAEQGYIEKKEDQIVCSVEDFKKAITDAYWGGLNGYINEYADDMLTIKKEGGGAEYYYNEQFSNLIK